MSLAETLAALRHAQERFAAAIREGDWLAARDIGRERHALVEAVARGPLAPEVVQQLQDIAAVELGLRARAESAHRDCGAALRDLRDGRRATRAYDKVGAG